MKEIINTLIPVFKQSGIILLSLSAAFSGTDYIMKINYPKDKIFLMWGSTIIIWSVFFILLFIRSKIGG